jgi:hypothetical protein
METMTYFTLADAVVELKPRRGRAAFNTGNFGTRDELVKFVVKCILAKDMTVTEISNKSGISRTGVSLIKRTNITENYDGCSS